MCEYCLWGRTNTFLCPLPPSPCAHTPRFLPCPCPLQVKELLDKEDGREIDEAEDPAEEDPAEKTALSAVASDVKDQVKALRDVNQTLMNRYRLDELSKRAALLMVFKRDLPNGEQSWRITSWHYWIVHGIAVSWIVNISALNPVSALRTHT